MFETKVLADSISEAGYRLTTFSVTFPRFVLAEVNTHRMFSRNSASSRAIPVSKSIQAVCDDPFIPESFGKNRPGMSFEESIADQDAAFEIWENTMAHAVENATKFEKLEVHKSLSNRILEPFKWHTAIISATDWSNFWTLRTAKDAQPEFRTIACMMQEAYLQSEPRTLGSGEWHLPLVGDDEIEAETYRAGDLDWEMWIRVAIGRCARVSYLTHEGVRDLQADINLHDRLLNSGHLSPFEHIARPFTAREWNLIDSIDDYITWIADSYDTPLRQRISQKLKYVGNFQGWYQRRAEIPFEDDASLANYANG